MRRFSLALLALLAVLAASLALAGCGGHKASLQIRATSPQSAMGSVHPAGWGQTPSGVALPRSIFGITQTADMYDAVTLSNIPGHPFAVAGYTAGRYTTWPALLRDFPSAHHVSIAIQASYRADCLDVEPGDAVPSQAGAWARADIAAGFRTPCLYSDLSEMPAVKASLAAAGLARSSYLLWLAWYRNIPGLVSGYDAVQWTDTCFGRNLDCDTVTLNFLRIAQPPYPSWPVCINKREPAATCAAAKAKIASDERAAASSERAWNARGCPALVARREWFAAHLNKPPKSRHAYRAGALAATTRAMARQGCPTFAQRVAFFSNAAGRLKAAN